MRTKPIQQGERVFDNEMFLTGTVISIIDGEKKDERQYVIRNDPEWNKTNLDTADEDMPETWTEKEEFLYQFVPGLRDNRYGYEVCYEHVDEIKYPYFCPALNENLFTLETIIEQ